MGIYKLINNPIELEFILKRVGAIEQIMEQRIKLIEEQLDDLKDELIVLHLKYGEVLEKLNSDIDRLFEILNSVR